MTSPDRLVKSNECVNVFTIQIKYTAQKTLIYRQILSQPKPRCNDDGVLNLHHDNDVKEVVSSQPSITCTNQPIRKLEFIQCMKVEFYCNIY